MATLPQTQAGDPQARLLVIDDEPAVLRLVKGMLTRAHYDVITCGSGSEGLKLIDEKEFDCIITDAIMPVMTGYDVVRAIRRHPQHQALPVLMLTRKRHRQDVKKAVEVGVSDYVLKPIDEYLLLDKVEICLKKGQGKRHIFELSLGGEEAQATLQLEGEIVTMSENDLTMRTPVWLTPDHSFALKSKIFDDIGIAMPLLKLTSCEESPDAVVDRKGLDYVAKLSFFGVPEADLKKIRAWLQKEAIRRRK